MSTAFVYLSVPLWFLPFVNHEGTRRKPVNQTMSAPEPADQLRYFQKRQKQIVETIRQLVELESPSDVKQSVDRVSTVLASRFGELGGKIKFHAAEKFGKHLQIDFRPRGDKGKPVLLLGHMDTVYPI